MGEAIYSSDIGELAWIASSAADLFVSNVLNHKREKVDDATIVHFGLSYNVR